MPIAVQPRPHSNQEKASSALTLNVTVLVHHRFIASTHPDLSVLFINPCRGLGLFLILPVPNQ